MIKVISAHMECCACPTIFGGKTDTGATVYARYRWGHLSVRIDPRDDPPHGGAEGAWFFEEEYGDQYDGCLGFDELKIITKGKVEWPAELSESPPQDYDYLEIKFEE